MHLYVGGAGRTSARGATMLASGETFADAYATLFSSTTKLASYDMILLPSEGEQLSNEKDPYEANMKAYADTGGLVLAGHLQSTWLRQGPAPWPSTATWIGVASDPPSPSTASVDTSFPDGAAFADWLVAAGASAVRGQLPLVMPQHSVVNVVAPTRRWLWLPSNPNDSQMRQATQVLTFDTPVESTSGPHCGRVAFVDPHVAAAGDSSRPETPFPTGCTAAAEMTAQEKATEFLFFQLGGCP